MVLSDHHDGPPLIFGSMVNILAKEGVLLVSQSAILSFLLVLIGSYPIVLTNIWWNLMGRVILTFGGWYLEHKVILQAIQGVPFYYIFDWFGWFCAKFLNIFEEHVCRSIVNISAEGGVPPSSKVQRHLSCRYQLCHLPQPTPSIPDILLCNKT